MERRPSRYAHAEGHTEVLYTSDGNQLLTCGSDGDIRIWAGLEDDDPRSVCVGEWALSIAFCEDKLYVSTDNNAVQIYSYPQFEKDGIVTRFTAPVTHIASSTKHPIMVCCSENMEGKVCIKNDKKWSTNLLAHSGPILGTALCPLGKYCITSCGDSLYRIWNLDDFSIIKEITGVPKVNSFTSAKVLGRASFEPVGGKLLAYPLNKEVVLIDTKTWQQKFVLGNSQIKSPFSICLFSPCGNYLAATNNIGQIIVWNVHEQKMIGLTDHPSSTNISSLAWNPIGNGELAFCDTSGLLATVINCFGNKDVPLEEELDLIDIIEREKENGDDASEFNNESEDDENENAISLRKLKNDTLKDNDDIKNTGSCSPSRSRSPSPKRPVNITAQLPFQPSSTPINLEHRYMCWNEVGIVRCHNTDDNSNIEVEFHDSNVHHSIHLNNRLNHTLASLSTTVLVLACEVPSKLVCIALFGGSKEWSVSFSDLEEILCITATDNLVAAATSARFLRLYTPCGTQLHVLSLTGSPVCLAGRKSILKVIYHASDPGIQDQHLAMDIIHLQGMSINCRRTAVPVALSSGTRLQWFGSTEKGSPVAADCSGILRLYDISSNYWIPICDMTIHYKGVSDSYFVISVNESAQFASAILCRGTFYPLTAPRPILTNLPIRLPLCEIETEKSQHEELLRKNIILRISDNKQSTEIILKLFALACRSEIEQRATEMIELLRDYQIAILAARYASRIGKLHLADKLTNLADSWKEKENIRLTPEPEGEIVNFLEEDPSLDTSIILPVKKPTELAPLKPMPFIKTSQTSKNPFRMSSGSDKSIKNGQNPLSLTDRTLVDDSSDSPKLTISKPETSETFPQWYDRNKEILILEHKELTPSELAKVGIKIFKNYLSQSTSKMTKRKHSPEPQDNNDKVIGTTVSKQSKLGAFAFKKIDP